MTITSSQTGGFTSAPFLLRPRSRFVQRWPTSNRNPWPDCVGIRSNFRADHQAKAEWGREVERLKLIHMPDFDDLIYDFRTMAERVNARLKDEFGARFLRVRSALKVKCHLMFGIVALAVDQIIRVVDYRTAPA